MLICLWSKKVNLPTPGDGKTEKPFDLFFLIPDRATGHYRQPLILGSRKVIVIPKQVTLSQNWQDIQVLLYWLVNPDISL